MKSTGHEGDLLDNIVGEPGAAYSVGDKSSAIYINPFRDKFFKKIFASETSKEMLRAFLNGVLEGKRDVQTVTYGKNEYPGELETEGNAAFDVICTDSDGATFLVEVQRVKQMYLKERSVFYASRLISDQAPKGEVKWKYDLKHAYIICLLEKFDLPDSTSEAYVHNIGLCDKKTGLPFYDKLEFIYLEIKKFNKQKEELHTALDEWLYALKHASDMNEVPDFFRTPELDYFFELAKFSNLKPEERNMYRTKQQVEWDNQNAFDFAREEGMEQGREQGMEIGREEERLKALAEKRVIAKNFRVNGIDLNIISKATGLSTEEIIAL